MPSVALSEGAALLLLVAGLLVVGLGLIGATMLAQWLMDRGRVDDRR